MDTRAQIVTLAVYQLKKGGYGELHFGDLASVLGISRTNIHYHFATKESLAREALTEFTEDELGRLQAIVEKYPSDFPKVLNAIDEYLEGLYSAHPGQGLCACSAFLLNNTNLPSSLRTLARDYFEELSAVFEAGIARSQKAENIQKSVNARDLAWECVLLMKGIEVLSGSIEAGEFAHNPASHLLKAKAIELVSLQSLSTDM